MPHHSSIDTSQCDSRFGDVTGPSWFGGTPEAQTIDWKDFPDPVPSRFFIPASRRVAPTMPLLSNPSLSTELLAPSSSSTSSPLSTCSPAPLHGSANELEAWLVRHGVYLKHTPPRKLDMPPIKTNKPPTESSSSSTKSSSCYSPAPLSGSNDELGAWLVRRDVNIDMPPINKMPINMPLVQSSTSSSTERASVVAPPRPLRKVYVSRYGVNVGMPPINKLPINMLLVQSYTSSSTERASVVALPRPLRKVYVPRHGGILPRYLPAIQQKYGLSRPCVEPQQYKHRPYPASYPSTALSAPPPLSPSPSPSPSLSPSVSPSPSPSPSPLPPPPPPPPLPRRLTLAERGAIIERDKARAAAAAAPPPPPDPLEDLAKYFANRRALRLLVETGVCPVETFDEKLPVAVPELIAGLQPVDVPVVPAELPATLDNDFCPDSAFVAEVDSSPVSELEAAPPVAKPGFLSRVKSVMRSGLLWLAKWLD